MNYEKCIKWRFDGLGASDAAVIMGLLPYGKTPYMLWQEKVNKIITEETEAMRHGKKYEDAALDWFEEKKGVALWRQLPTVDKEYDWLRATIDGLGDHDTMVEAKVPFNLQNHYRVRDTAEVPDIYYPQCQHQLRVKNLKEMYFLSYNWQDPDDSVILTVHRDEDYIKEMIEEASKFWNLVLTKQPPELADYDYVSMSESQEWKNLAQEYLELDNKITFYENRKEQIKLNLRSLSKDKSARGHGIELQKQEWKGRVDYDNIPELKGINLDPYRKESSIRWPIRKLKK